MASDFPYFETTEDFLSKVRRIEESRGERLRSINIAAAWLYDFDDSLLSETERLNVILPLIKFCIERNDLPPKIKGELEYYHAEYTEGNLNQYLDPAEADAVIRDLEWSFHAAFPNEK